MIDVKCKARPGRAPSGTLPSSVRGRMGVRLSYYTKIEAETEPMLGRECRTRKGRRLLL
jgi:hypothetical protein